MSLWAIKNDEGKYQTECAGDLWRELGDDTEVYGEKFDAMEDAREFGGHVVEMAEKSAPIVVSEAEAKILEGAKKDKHPSMYIAWKVQVDDEDRLMRAYVIGWTVEKPKRWNVKVPHTKDVWYYKSWNSDLRTISDKELCSEFTEAEIEQYGLQDCERKEVTEDDE